MTWRSRRIDHGPPEPIRHHHHPTPLMNKIQIVGQIDKTKQKIVFGKSKCAELLIPPSSDEINDVADQQFVQITGDVWSHPDRPASCIIRAAIINNFPGDKHYWSTGRLRLHSPEWVHQDTFSSRSLIRGTTEGKDFLHVLMPLSESKWAKKVGGRIGPHGYVDLEVEITGLSRLACVSVLDDKTAASAKKQAHLPSSNALDAYDKQCQEMRHASGKRKNLSPKIRRQVFLRDGFKCQECGAHPGKQKTVWLEVDHIIPVAKGGLNDLSNLRTLCDACNCGKGTEPAIIHS